MCNLKFSVVLCGVMVFASSVAGCKKPEPQRVPLGFTRPLTKKEEKIRENLQEKSDELHRQSTAEHEGKLRETDPGGGTLTLGEQSLAFSEISLLLGSLNAPGDLGGGQAPSQLATPSGVNPSLSVFPLAVGSATNAQQIAGQSFTCGSSSNMTAEITAADGGKWLLDNTAINFSRAEQSVVFFIVEGQAADASGQKPEKIKVTGELRARVKSETETVTSLSP